MIAELTAVDGQAMVFGGIGGFVAGFAISWIVCKAAKVQRKRRPT
jgi:hypothetical protein